MNANYQIALIITLTGLVALALIYTSIKMRLDLLARQLKDSNKRIVEEISSSVQTKFIELKPSAKNIVDLGVEVWRLEKKFEKLNSSLNEDQLTSLHNSLMKLTRYLELNDIEVKDYTNQKYNDGMNLEVITSEKHPDLEQSIVGLTDTPAILHRGQLIKRARVIIYEK